MFLASLDKMENQLRYTWFICLINGRKKSVQTGREDEDHYGGSAEQYPFPVYAEINKL